MTGRWEAAAEAQIRAAQERGEFDDLPGAGKPLPGRNLPYDESWWIKSFLEREQIPGDLLLPTPLLLRRRIEKVPDEVRDLPTEASVRAYVGDLNRQVLAWLRNPTGPKVAVRPVDVDEVVRGWRAERERARAEAAVVTPPQPPPARSRRGWWRPWRRH